jgi:hypothetical protein
MEPLREQKRNRALDSLFIAAAGLVFSTIPAVTRG